MSKRAAEVLVELILGHRAAIREKPTPEGYTHDWEVYVKAEQGNIQTFVQCVIFTLHESFPNPIRMVNNPPYCVKESGYAGFIVKIEILFRNKNEPKKAVFHYDLFLQSGGPPIHPSRKEKLIFNNPGSELTKKLIKGGGTVVSEVVNDKPSSATPSVGGGSGYHSGGGKSKPATVSSAKVSPKNSFENLFGIPIKRSSNAPPSTTSSTSVSSSSSSALSTKNGSNSKESKSGGNKKHDKSSSSRNHLPQRVKSPLTPESTVSATSSSSKSSTSIKKEKEVKIKKEKGSSKNMLPPSNTSVPKKAKKSEMFADDLSPPSSSKHSKSEKSSSSKSKRIKSEGLDIKPDMSHDSRSYSKKSERDRPSSRGSEKPPLSPISSSSGSNSSSTCSSPHSSKSSNHTDDESESDQVVSAGREGTPTKKSSSSNPSSSTSGKRSKNSLCRSPSSAYTGSTPSPESSTSSSSSLSTDIPSSSSKKRKGSSSGSRSPPSKKIALDKSVSSSNNRGDYSRESNKSKKKNSKGGGVGSSEEVSSAISPDPSLSSKSSKKHHVIEGMAENSGSSRKSKSYLDNSSSRHKSLEVNNSRHLITACAISTSSSRGMRRSKGHDHEMLDAREQDSEPESDVNSEELVNSEPETPSPPESVSSDRANENGIVSNSVHTNNNNGNSPGGMLANCGGLGFSHAGVAGNITAEMKLLKELHARISTMIHDDPNKLQEIVDIVESSGKDCWNMDTGLTFDFDLCKLSSTTINRLKQAVL